MGGSGGAIVEQILYVEKSIFEIDFRVFFNEKCKKSLEDEQSAMVSNQNPRDRVRTRQVSQGFLSSSSSSFVVVVVVVVVRRRRRRSSLLFSAFAQFQ